MFNSQAKANLQRAIAKADAIDKSQAVIEFNLDGTIVTANANFLGAMGYTLARDQGQASQHVCRHRRARERGLPRILGPPEPRRVPGRAVQADRQGRPRGLDPGLLQSDPRRQRKAGRRDQVRNRHHRAENPVDRRRRQDRRDQPGPGRDRVRDGRHHHHREREFPRRPRLFAGRDPRQAPQHVRDAGRPRQRRLSRILGANEPGRL